MKPDMTKTNFLQQPRIIRGFISIRRNVPIGANTPLEKKRKEKKRKEKKRKEKKRKENKQKELEKRKGKEEKGRKKRKEGKKDELRLKIS